jgi:hypothetical protein
MSNNCQFAPGRGALQSQRTLRKLEQKLYDQFHPPMNVNRPIRIGNPKTTSYKEAASQFLKNLFGIK